MRGEGEVDKERRVVEKGEGLLTPQVPCPEQELGQEA